VVVNRKKFPTEPRKANTPPASPPPICCREPPRSSASFSGSTEMSSPNCSLSHVAKDSIMVGSFSMSSCTWAMNNGARAARNPTASTTTPTSTAKAASPRFQPFFSSQCTAGSNAMVTNSATKTMKIRLERRQTSQRTAATPSSTPATTRVRLRNLRISARSAGVIAAPGYVTADPVRVFRYSQQ